MMGAAALASLIAQLIPVGIQVYNEIASADSTVPPLATILASADVDWNAVAATAQGQLGTATPATTK